MSHFCDIVRVSFADLSFVEIARVIFRAIMESAE